MSDTHFSKLIAKKRVVSLNTEGLPGPTSNPISVPRTGDFFWDKFTNSLFVFDTNQWYYAAYSTTTSTSTSTTTTSTSTTTTSTSTTTTTSTSTSTSTSTTTTL